MRKELNEQTMDELKKTRKKTYGYAYIIFIIGMVFQGSAWILYFSTFIIGLPVMTFVFGAQLYLIAGMMLQNASLVSLMIDIQEKIE